MVGDSRSTSHRANVSRFGGAPGGQRMQERRHARVDRLCRLEEIATLEDVGRARLLALAKHQLRRTLPGAGLQKASIRSFASFHSGTVVRQ